MKTSSGITRWLFNAFILTLSVGIALPSHAEEEWVPVYKEPKHRLAFENDHAMILDVFLPPGYVSLYHQHVLDVLYVTIVGTTVTAQPLGGELRQATVTTGDLRFSSDNHGIPHIHQVGNIGETPFHVIGVGIKDPVAGIAAPIKGDTSGMTLDMEKDHASVYRVKLGPGEASGIHTHTLPFVSVNLNAGMLAEASGESVAVKAGAFRWHPAGLTHSYKNTGDRPIEIIEIQWR